MADPDARVFINTDICEGCGDCGVQSNCVSIVPVDTEFGRKRAIDQSSCNKDLSCIKGFCPSFVTLQGARPKRAAAAAIDLPDLPDPALPAIDGTFNIVVTGIGGTGIVTLGAILAMAAHLEGKGAGVMEMSGMAQKGGAVHVHCRIAAAPADISAIRVAAGEADAVIGGDLVVTAGAQTLGLMTMGRTRAVVNAHEVITGDFTRNSDFRLPSGGMTLALQARLRGDVTLFDATDLARVALGDSIYSNMVVLGAAWQNGLIPLTQGAILRAIDLNGTEALRNARAFQLGRWAMAHPGQAAALQRPAAAPVTGLADRIDLRARHLADYQNEALADRYRALVAAAPDDLRDAVAQGYHQLLSCKDEYEVARLHLATLDKARAEFDGTLRPQFHLAPPFLSRKGADGRPAKRTFGPWVAGVFRLLAWAKPLRGTAFDPFAHSADRRLERALVAEYETDMAAILPRVTPATQAIARDLALLPLTIRGFGPVKHANAARAAATRASLLAAFHAGGTPITLAAE